MIYWFNDYFTDLFNELLTDHRQYTNLLTDIFLLTYWLINVLFTGWLIKWLFYVFLTSCYDRQNVWVVHYHILDLDTLYHYAYENKKNIRLIRIEYKL
jgi:hypothetical protein